MMNKKDFIWYTGTMIFLWLVVSTLLAFGTMLIRFVAGYGINYGYFLFYPFMGIMFIGLYLFGFVYVRLESKENPGVIV